MKSLKRLTIALLIAILLIGMSNIVLATEEDENYIFIPDDGADQTNNNNNNTNVENPYNNVANTNTNNNANTNNNTNTNKTNNSVNNSNSSKYNNTNLPAAGSQDARIVMVIVAVFGISALYAYKKIRDYNIK